MDTAPFAHANAFPTPISTLMLKNTTHAYFPPNRNPATFFLLALGPVQDGESRVNTGLYASLSTLPPAHFHIYVEIFGKAPPPGSPQSSPP
jgi:hypothetical protein